MRRSDQCVWCLEVCICVKFLLTNAYAISTWKWPNVEGLSDFKGKLMHSADWDDKYDFAGKKVAVVGIGSSAIQIVPQLARGERLTE